VLRAGWGSSRWWACGSNNTLLRTTDGGSTWQLGASPSTAGVDWKGAASPPACSERCIGGML
jgi:hypothetical protein